MQKESLVDRLKSRRSIVSGVIVVVLAVPLALVAPLIAVSSSLRDLARDPQTQNILIATVLLLFSGVLLFHWVEDFRWLDSLYFSFITLATIGYGDFAPETDAGKLLTIVYSIAGLGILAALINAIVTQQRRRARQTGRRQSGEDSHLQTGTTE